MREKATPRIVWLFPFAPRGGNRRGAYWQPVLSEFFRLFPDTTVFSAPPVGAVELTRAAKARYLTFWTKDRKPRLALAVLLVRVSVRILRLRPDLVFASGFGACSLLSILLKAFRPLKVVVVYDGSSPAVDVRNQRYRLMARRLTVRFSDAFITNSFAAKKYLIDLLGASEDRVFSRPYLVANAAALSAAGGQGPTWQAELKRPVFLYVGRLMSHKGFSVLFSACAALKSRGRDGYSVLIVGEGPERSAFEAQAERLGLGSNVRFAGWVEYGLLSGYLRSSDVFVFPSLSDPWGMAVLEAMAYSKPVICSRRAGASELVVDGENGFVFDPGRPDALTDLMERFIDDPSMAERMGRRAREMTAEMNPASAAAGLGHVVRRALDMP